MDLTNTDFTPIGTEEHPFEGIFEGPSEAGELPTLKKSGLPASAPAACPTLKKSGLPASAPAACSGKPTQVLR